MRIPAINFGIELTGQEQKNIKPNIMKKNLIKTLGVALTGLVLAGSGGIASAQTNIIFTYDTTIPHWTTWYNINPTFSWSTNDAAGNPASGSLAIYIPYGDANGNNSQSVFFSGYNQDGTSLLTDLNTYTNVEFDILVDQSSIPNNAGYYGTMQVFAANPYSTSPKIGDYPVPPAAATNWQHVSMPIPAGIGSWRGPAFWFQGWYPGSTQPNQPNGPVTYYIDNYKLDAGPPTAKIITQPVSQELFSTSSNVTWTVSASGGAPLSYQWYKGTTALADGVSGSGSVITGSASNVLQITGIGAGDIANNYKVIITNSYSSTTSSVVSLSIVLPVGAYAKAMVTNYPVAFYELNETSNPATGKAGAYDHIGGLAGVYGTTVSNLFDGVTGPSFVGFGPNNGAAGFHASGTPVTLPPLNLNTNAVTITAWINPTAVVADAGIINTRDNGTTAGLVWASSTGSLGYNWNDVAATYDWQASGCNPPMNEWSFVALVITPDDATIYCMNASGLVLGENPIANANAAFAGKTLIGQDSIALIRTFAGKIDDVAIFNYSLTTDQLQKLYFAGAGGPTLRFDGVNLTWDDLSQAIIYKASTTTTLQEAPSVLGPWTDLVATSPWPVYASDHSQHYYRLKVQ
jgi:hypothetical protein